jgi:hypothetical protein
MVERYRGSEEGEVRAIGKLTAFRFNAKKSRWAIVTHPLWDTDNPIGILKEAGIQLEVVPEFADTFELSRRQVTERERLIQAWA